MAVCVDTIVPQYAAGPFTGLLLAASLYAPTQLAHNPGGVSSISSLFFLPSEREGARCNANGFGDARGRWRVPYPPEKESPLLA